MRKEKKYLFFQILIAVFSICVMLYTAKTIGSLEPRLLNVDYSELTPSATTEIIDPNLKDASGFNADFGYRGSVKNYLNFDVGLFYLQYDNRIGTLTQNGAPFKTNIGKFNIPIFFF